MSKLRHAAALYTTVAALTVLCALIAAAAYAAKGGQNGTSATPCTAPGNIVYGTGLPTDELINFMVTDSSGTWGIVLGFTPDGTWAVGVPAPTGPTKYEFVSRTYGPNGTKYRVFQSCSV
jgi:hypothetical protein